MRCLLAVLVDATIEHPFPFTVTVRTEMAARLLGDISNTLDHMGLVRGEHWSLNAEVDGQNVHLRFALDSQASADQLRRIVIDVAPDEPVEPKSADEQVGFGIGGPASGKFLDVFRIPKSVKIQAFNSQYLTDT